MEELEKAGEAVEQRFRGMWFPNLPGIWPHDIAEKFAEYLCYRAVEEWAGRQ